MYGDELLFQDEMNNTYRTSTVPFTLRTVCTVRAMLETGLFYFILKKF